MEKIQGVKYRILWDFDVSNDILKVIFGEKMEIKSDKKLKSYDNKSVRAIWQTTEDRN